MDNNNNNISVTGRIAEQPVFSHEVMGERFYKFKVKVPRLSEIEDVLPVTVSEKLMFPELCGGAEVHITGQLRSYNKYDENGAHLVLTIFVGGISLAEDEPEPESETEPETEGEKSTKNPPNPNEIFIDGYICKKPIYRKTPFGREITDLIVAVNRAFNRSDYIPAIAWGRNAVYTKKLEVGTNVRIWGRLQSREYVKRLSEEESETRTAYEVSITKLETIA